MVDEPFGEVDLGEEVLCGEESWGQIGVTLLLDRLVTNSLSN